MPCYVTGSREGDSDLAWEEARAEATKVTAMLCALCDRIDGYMNINGVHAINDIKGLRNWWNKHKKIDEQRTAQEIAAKAREDLKNRALKKLTVEERAILGLIK